MIRPALLVVVAVVLVTPAAAAAGGAESRPDLSGGEASASGVFATYSDSDTFIEGGTVGPPATDVPVAAGSLDLTGHGTALAALAYNPLLDAPGAVNSLAGTDLPAEEVAGRFRAKVSGRPPKEAAVSGLVPGYATGRARLTPGPVAEASVTTAQGDAAVAHVAAGDNEVRVDATAGRTVSAAAVVLRHVTVGGVLTFRSVEVRATALSDGDASRSEATVTVEGAAVNGVPILLTPEGVVVAGEATGAETATVRRALAEAGIELVAPGSESSHHDAQHARAVGVGPRFVLSDPEGHRVEVTLGRAEAGSTLVSGSSG